MATLLVTDTGYIRLYLNKDDGKKMMELVKSGMTYVASCKSVEFVSPSQSEFNRQRQDLLTLFQIPDEQGVMRRLRITFNTIRDMTTFYEAVSASKRVPTPVSSAPTRYVQPPNPYSVPPAVAPVQYSSSSSSSTAQTGYRSAPAPVPAPAPAPVHSAPPARSSHDHSHRRPSSLEDEEKMLEEAMRLSARTTYQEPPSTEIISERDLEGYVTVGEIGAGGQGSLFKGKTRDGRHEFVIKKIPCATSAEKDQTEVWAIQFQMSVKHQNIISYLKVDGRKKNEVVILMPMYTEGDMEKYIVNAKRAIDERIIVNYLAQISSALNYLHTFTVSGKPHPMLHRDLKPANVLLAEGHTKCILIDFDSWGRTGIADREGTMEYMSPEATSGRGRLGCPSDIFSLGVMLYILMVLPSYPMLELGNESLCLNAPDWGREPQKLRDAVTRAIQKHSSSYSKELIDICLQMLSHNPEERPNAEYLKTRFESMAKRFG